MKDKKIGKVKDKDMVFVNILMAVSIKVTGKVINSKDMVF
jgi:hypothetical protein